MPNNNLQKLSLIDQIKTQIKTHGPISLATYMAQCLTHPEHGYYKTADPFGAQGDFITAPEISQMFGEMLGAWVLMQWHALDCPKQFDLVELGPGRGTLMADAMRVFAKDANALDTVNIVLLETNPILIDLQKHALPDFSPRWITEIDQLAQSPNPKIILANEFFDALPIRQFQFDKDRWHERLIGLNSNKLTWGLSPTPMPASAIPPQIKTPQDGEIWETCPLATQTVFQLGKLINHTGGAALIIDYGYEKTQTGDTFQALLDHRFANPLDNPGDADLSAHVNFEALIEGAREAGSQARFTGSQGAFLKQLQIEQRAKVLSIANPNRAKSISNDLARLVDKKQMGELFKTMVIFGARPAPMKLDSSLGAHPTISHGFFGRAGGCSATPFASLNVSTSMGDHRDNALNNRAIACSTLAISPKKLVILKQIHSAKIITIDEDFDCSTSPRADGMVSRAKGFGLGILTADCCPVLFADPEAGVIGACHSGWQGAVDGIITNTIKSMIELGANPKNIIAAFGPTIWLDNYEVGEIWAEDFLTKHPDASRFIVKSGKTLSEHFDLPGFVHADLKKNQVANISQIGNCTYANPEEYFSHRYATHQKLKTGRQIAIICLNQQ